MDPFATEGIRSPLPSPRLTQRVQWPLPLFGQRQAGKGRRRRGREDCTLPPPLTCSLRLGPEAVAPGVSDTLKLPEPFFLLGCNDIYGTGV